MAGERGVNRQTGCFFIANFSHHHNVRILPDERAQTVRESETDFRFDLRLIDARNLIFNRIFNRRNVNVRFV